MTLSFDPSSDLTAADGIQNVTLMRRGAAAGSSGTSVTGALLRAVTTREAARSNGKCTASDVVCHLPGGELGDGPRLGDVIVDADGRRWTILDAALCTLKTRWRCTARNLAVVYVLDDTVTILKASFTKSDGGAAEATWRPWKTGVRARIQPRATEPDTPHRARQAVARYQIFLEEDLALDHTHRILGPDGTIYKVTAIVGAESIGHLQTIEAEVTPWLTS